MKKQIITLLFGGALLVGGLVACSSQTKTNKVDVGEKRVNTLAYQATTSLATLKNHVSYKMMRDGSSSIITEETKNKIEELLPSLDLLLENNGSFESEVLTSDRENYEVKQVVSFQGLAMERSEYTLYYNIFSENVTTEVDDDDKTEEIETTKKFVGIAVLDQVELPFTSVMETETEGNEYEEEMKFVIETGLDSYISVKQEIEKKDNEYEEEYHYTIVENNKKVYEFVLENELENSKNETEVKLTIDGKKYKFDVYQKNKETFIDVKVDGTNEKVTYKKVIKTDEETGRKTVTFEQVI